MQFERGQIVRSKKGRDKGYFFVVLSVSKETAMICDGKYRTLSRPKRKKLIHLAPTKTVIDERSMAADSTIGNAVAEFNNNKRTS